MNKIEAECILSAELSKYEALDYAPIVSMVNAPKIVSEILAESGVRYYLDVRAWWDDKARGHVRVSCNVDDGGARALLPLTGDFVKEPPTDLP